MVWALDKLTVTPGQGSTDGDNLSYAITVQNALKTGALQGTIDQEAAPVAVWYNRHAGQGIQPLLQGSEKYGICNNADIPDRPDELLEGRSKHQDPLRSDV